MRREAEAAKLEQKSGTLSQDPASKCKDVIDSTLRGRAFTVQALPIRPQHALEQGILEFAINYWKKQTIRSSLVATFLMD
jgi:hypothetical protein